MSQEARNISIYSILIGAVTLNDNLQQIDLQEQWSWVMMSSFRHTPISIIEQYAYYLLLVPGCKVNNTL